MAVCPPAKRGEGTDGMEMPAVGGPDGEAAGAEAVTPVSYIPSLVRLRLTCPSQREGPGRWSFAERNSNLLEAIGLQETATLQFV